MDGCGLHQAFRIQLCKDWWLPFEGENNREDIGLGYFTEILCRLSNKKAIASHIFLYTMKESKEPHLQGGALKPKFQERDPETILNQVQDRARDDSKTRTKPSCHAWFSIWSVFICLWQTHLSSPSLPAGRQAQDGVFRCDLNKGMAKEGKMSPAM